MDLLRAEGLGPDAGREQEEGVAALDDGRGAGGSLLPRNRDLGVHQRVRRQVAVEVHADDLVEGDAEVLREALRVCRLDLVPLAVPERDRGDAVRAVLLHGEREAGRAVLAAAEHDDRPNVLLVHGGDYSTGRRIV